MNWSSAYEYAYVWFADYHNWSGILVIGAFALLIGYILRLRDPRHQERAMAKRLEKQCVADILSAALQDAAHKGTISPKVWHKYNKKIADRLGLEDMMPKVKDKVVRDANGKWISIPFFNLSAATSAAYKRLRAMGVKDIAGKLISLRSRRSVIKAQLKKIKPVSLPQ